MKQDQWFKHDNNADSDPKIQRLLMKLGNAGYGLYWRLVERLYREGGSIPADYEMLAFAMGTQMDAIRSLVEDFELFYLKDSNIGSNSVDRRLQERVQMSEQGRVFAMKRWGAKGGPMGTQKVPNANRVEKNRVEKKEFGPSFEAFWSAYPKRQAKQDAIRAWKKIDSEPGILSAVLEAIGRQKLSDAWTKDGGKFIPLPASWLNGRRWEDEIAGKSDDLIPASLAFADEDR